MSGYPTRLRRGSFLARLAQPAERKALNLVVVGSSPTVGAACFPQNDSPCTSLRRGFPREKGTEGGRPQAFFNFCFRKGIPTESFFGEAL